MRYIATLLAIVLVGCAPRGEPQPWRRPAPAAATPARPIDQVHQGMGQGAVRDLLGEPTDKSTTHITGKVFIPFYFGDDAFEETWHYKGVGRAPIPCGRPPSLAQTVVQANRLPSKLDGFAVLVLRFDR